MEAYHRILGVTPDDSEDYINQRYRELSQVWHPDKCGKYNYCSNDRKLLFTEQQQLINEAHRKLKSQIRKNDPTQPKRYRSFEIGGNDVALHDLFSAIILILSIYATLKIFISARGPVFRVEKIISFCFIFVSFAAVYFLGESEHIDKVMWSISPIYTLITFQAIKDLLKFAKYILYTSIHYLVALIALSLAVWMVMNDLPRISAVIIWLFMVIYYRVINSRVLLFCSLACFWFIRSPSDSTIMPMQELINEATLLRIYTSMFILTRIFGDFSTINLALSFYACIEKRNCSGHIMAQMAQTLVLETNGRIYEHITSFIQFTPHLLIAAGMWQVLTLLSTNVTNGYGHARHKIMVYWGRFNRSSDLNLSKSKVNEECSAEADEIEETNGDGSSHTSGDEFHNKVSILTRTIDGLSRADAAMHLRAREGDVEEAIAYLQTPAGKASRAAQSRVKKAQSRRPETVSRKQTAPSFSL